MKFIQTFIFFLLYCTQTFALEPAHACDQWPKWFKSACIQLTNTWTKGSIDLYATGYAWHNRYLYSEAKLRTYNEGAFGGGLGKGYDDDDGDWNSLYTLAFLDSHKNVEPVAGYAFIKTTYFSENTRAGLGYTILVTARPDIFKGRPFPGILPLLSVSYRRLSLFATYIPGAQGAGNVLFCFAKYTL